MYAEVIVDISNERVDRLFTYSIPEGLTLTPGQRVLVPLRGQAVEGYVIELSAETALHAAQIRAVIKPLESYAAILPELIDLSRYLRDHCHCNLVDGLRQMIPAQMRKGRVREKSVAMVRLLAEGEALEEARVRNQRSKNRLKVLDALKDGPLPLAQLRALGGDAAKKLAEQQVVAIDAEETYRRPYSALGEACAPDPVLMPGQRAALRQLTAALDGEGGRFLLHGVTGSGKTEVYIRAIRHALAQGRTAIVLVPEISLTPQMVDWFRARFGACAAVLHSRLSAGERYDEWRRIRLGDARVVIGARSAVFAPVERLGIVIVDEEHESSYVSEKRPCYDAREVAKQRAAYHHGVLLLGSATPAIATYMKAMPMVRPENRLTLIEMTERVKGRAMPEVEIVDMRSELVKGNRSIFSAALMDGLAHCLEENHQAILFINRRGHSTFVSCRACGHVERCEQCDVSMTYHMAEHVLRCHYCGAERQPPMTCPECGSRFIKYFGAGTQKVEEEIKALLPSVSVLRMDMDTTAGKDGHEKIVSAFRKGEAKILIGTQMIAKGLDFPNVTLVGVIAADLSLNVPDYRSVERTFQLITQVAGRAGRAEYPGRVIVQTYDPDHYGIQLAARQDYRAFYLIEEKNRRRGLYPPFTVIARLLVSAKDERKAQAAALALEAELNAALDADPRFRRDVVQMRALEAPLKLLRGEARWQVFLKMYARAPAEEVLSRMEELEKQPLEDVRVELEINPASMI